MDTGYLSTMGVMSLCICFVPPVFSLITGAILLWLKNTKKIDVSNISLVMLVIFCCIVSGILTYALMEFLSKDFVAM